MATWNAETTRNNKKEGKEEFPNHPTSASRTVLERTLELVANNSDSGNDDNGTGDTTKELRFLFLGCEADDTYGPYDHTATLFIELICRAVQEYYQQQEPEQQEPVPVPVPPTPNKNCTINIHVTLTVYRISQGDYPTDLSDEEWDQFHGIIVPGSHGAAYDESTPWIIDFGNLLRTKHQPGRPPMLGICFGHQLLAHVAADADGDGGVGGGKAVLCPNGTQVGRKSMTVTKAGRRILFPRSVSDRKPQQSTSSPSQEETKEGSTILAENGDSRGSSSQTIDLYYSHGDMVQQLPSHAIVLASSDKVPIQAAAYFASEQEALEFITRNDDDEKNSSSNDTTMIRIRPTAITFQAHPEFAVSRTLGLERTLGRIMNGMEHRGVITLEARQEIGHDAQMNFDSVERHSLQVLMRVGHVLEWW